MQYQLPILLTHNNITLQLNMLVNLLKDNPIIELNLANIKAIDSAGVALLIELKEQAVSLNKQIIYHNHTTELINLCKLYNVTI